MNLKKLSIDEKLELAITTSDRLVLNELILSPNMIIRRAVLRNRNVTADIVNLLTFDAVENVSYIASNHRMCTEKRNFDSSVSKCVICTDDERTMSCENCNY